MTPPKETRLIPALLRMPEISATLDSLDKTIDEMIEEQAKRLDMHRTATAAKTDELEKLRKENHEGSGTHTSPEVTIDEFREPFAKAMAEISVALWRIKQTTDKLEEGKETRRILRDLTNCVDALKTLGFETIDRSKTDFSTGIYRNVEVISNEMTSEVTEVTVSEVLKPAVHFRVQHALLRKTKERVDQPPFIVQKCQVVTKSPPLPGASA